MARPQANLHFQYFPTPPRVTDMIASHLRVGGAGKVAILDPCAGEGIAVMQLAHTLGECLVDGVELTEERAAICRGKDFHSFVEGDTIIEIDWRPGQYDLLWFNPPYQYDKEEKRLEIAFWNAIMRRHDKRVLKHGGIFVGLLTQKMTANPQLAELMLALLEGPNGEAWPQVFAFPMPEWESFGQVVILGRMRQKSRGRISEEKVQAFVEHVMSDELPDLDFAEEPDWIVPSHPKGAEPKPLIKMAFDPAEALLTARKKGWVANKTHTERLWRKRQRRVRPLRTLSDAHLGVAMAAGLFDEEVLDCRPEGGPAYLVRGDTNKHATTKHDETMNGTAVRIVTEHFESVIYAIDLQTGKRYSARMMSNKVPA